MDPPAPFPQRLQRRGSYNRTERAVIWTGQVCEFSQEAKTYVTIAVAIP
jgi:hypothetical protein